LDGTATRDEQLAASCRANLAMPVDFATVLAIAAVAAVASPIGGLFALWRAPTSLFMSIALGFASGVLLATISFEMVPKALELSSLTIAVAGFVVGFLAIYGFDLFIHRGRVAGEKAQQHAETERFHRRKRPRGGEVTVLAGAAPARKR
jgi:ZIP family zinc transporter